jgi:hypothetical protein
VKRWHAIAVALVVLLILISSGAPAYAQSFEQVPPVLAAVISKTGVMIDSVLGHWVSGNALTNPGGEQLVADAARTVVNTVHFLAQLVTLF